MKNIKKLLCLVLALLMSLCLVGCGDEISAEDIGEVIDFIDEVAGELSDDTPDVPLTSDEGAAKIHEDGAYTSKEDVALYIYTYGHLPKNYITKSEARELGWEGGSLEPYAPGKCIGGDRFGNYEGLLPEEEGRSYTECDIDTLGADDRGKKRIVFSNDGLVFYTDDHYESFELLYGDYRYA